MAAIAKALLSNFTPVFSVDDSLIAVALFCGAGLLLSLAMISYGVEFGAF
jgi:hypothetical protein